MLVEDLYRVIAGGTHVVVLEVKENEDGDKRGSVVFDGDADMMPICIMEARVTYLHGSTYAWVENEPKDSIEFWIER